MNLSSKISIAGAGFLSVSLYLQTQNPLPQKIDDDSAQSAPSQSVSNGSSNSQFLDPNGNPVDPSQFTLDADQIPDGYSATPIQQGNPAVDYDGIPPGMVPAGDTYQSGTALAGFRGDQQPGFVANPGSGLQKGDQVLLTANGRSVVATVYDVGPQRNTANNITEASPAALEALGYGIRGSNGTYTNSVNGNGPITVSKLNKL